MYGMYYKLPRYVKIKNEKFMINTDYRIFINFENDMQGLDRKEAIIKALKNFYGSAFSLIIDNNLLEEAVEKFIWFYQCGKNKQNSSPKSSKNSKTNIFNYEYDYDLIWASFWMYAHIDISTARLHWWKFKSIWNALPSDCEFNKIKGYRGYTGKDKDILELKEYYKLPPTAAEIEDQIRREKIYEALK